MNGVLVVDKPPGPTSHDVVARVRRALRIRKIGHTGTLDPLATGVLPLVVGLATRLARFLAADEKEYIAEVRFGAATATYDAEAPPPLADVSGLTAEAIEALLPEFRGAYQQTPPPFSAKKLAGTPAYRLARAQQPVEIAPAAVQVRALELLSFGGGTARLRIVSSSGFYVRTLAHDLGQRAGCGAHLASLRRVRAGEFREAGAVALDEVERVGPDASRWIIPMERLLASLPSVVLTERGLRRAAHGNELSLEDVLQVPASRAEAVRLLDAGGALLGIAEPRPGGLLHPCVVLV